MNNLKHCIDCKKRTKGYGKRCRSCATMSLHKKGRKNPNYKHGKYCKKYYCKVCGKLLQSIKAKTCNRHKKISKKTRNKMSKNHANVSGNKNPMFGKVTHGKWTKYKGIFMRSSYEIAYAKYLDKNNIKWEYESKAFDLGNCSYTPDFYLPEKNMYIEIKGWWRGDAKMKFKKFRKIYSDINIEILNKVQLENMEVLKCPKI